MNTTTIAQLPEFEIKLKSKQKASERISVTGSKDAANVAIMCFDADNIEWTESFIVIALNRANKVLGFYKVSQGGLTGTIVDPRVIFQFALLTSAVALIIAHNHPSGNLTPSRADIEITEKIKKAGDLLEIKLLDHVIVTGEGYYSFCDNGTI